MDDYKKIELINSLSAILVLHSESMKSTINIVLAVQQLINALPNKISDELQNDIEFIIETILFTQKQIQKAGTAHILFMDSLLKTLEISNEPKGLKNVRRGRLKKKD